MKLITAAQTHADMVDVKKKLAITIALMGLLTKTVKQVNIYQNYIVHVFNLNSVLERKIKLGLLFAG